jgi:hypothetical protein
MGTATYKLQVASEQSSRLIEIRKPDGTIYRVALGEFGAPEWRADPVASIPRGH